jgi:hypothetical protein
VDVDVEVDGKNRTKQFKALERTLVSTLFYPISPSTGKVRAHRYFLHRLLYFSMKIWYEYYHGSGQTGDSTRT